MDHDVAGMVAGLIVFFIYAYIETRTPRYSKSSTPQVAPIERVYIPYVPPVPKTSSVKQPNLSFREQLERVQERQAKVHISPQDKARKRYVPRTKAATWFIGTWGISDPSPAEQLIINELKKYKIRWYREVSFSDLITPSGGYCRFDIYLPAHQTAIEYQGAGYHDSHDRVASDKLKAKYCKDNGIKLHIYDVQHYRTMESTIAGLMKSLKVSLK